MSWAAIVVGVGSIAYGAVKSGQANRATKKALANRKPYKTPDEVFEMLNAVTQKAQGDTETRDFQTQQIDNAFAGQLEIAELLGADPNDLSAMFNQKMQGIIQVGENFHRSNMEAFGNYLSALNVVGQNKAAEAGSADNLIKDELQALALRKSDANKTINSGLNLGMAGWNKLYSDKLYKPDEDNNNNNNNGFDSTGFN